MRWAGIAVVFIKKYLAIELFMIPLNPLYPFAEGHVVVKFIDPDVRNVEGLQFFYNSPGEHLVPYAFIEPSVSVEGAFTVLELFAWSCDVVAVDQAAVAVE